MGNSCPDNFSTSNIEEATICTDARIMPKGCGKGIWGAPITFAIVCGPARSWSREHLGYIMKTCVILHNMIIEDERDENAEEPTQPIELLREPTPTFSEFISRYQMIQSSAIHHTLRNDLIEHIWSRQGPLAFNTTKYKGGLPALILYPYSWTKTSSIIFLDAPVGAGFSYARSAEGYNVSDKSSASQAYEFLRKWLKEHRNFITNQLFIGGDSYSGLITPIIAQEILNGNEAGLKPRLNLKGYVIGSPHANQELQDNAQIPYAHRMALISDRLYESAKRNCKGNYVNIDPSNPKCLEDLEAIQERIGQVPVQNILYPKCATLSPKPDEEQVRRSLHSNDFWCWNFDYLLSDMWANDKRVQNALHVRKGTVKEWFRCNASLTASYTYDVHNAIGYHENLTKTGLQVLLFSGDHDMLIPHSFVEDWIKSLDVPVDSSWRPWFVDGQVAGYTVKYKNIGYRLTYATVKGAGHSPEEFKRRECYEMFERWIHYYPL